MNRPSLTDSFDNSWYNAFSIQVPVPLPPPKTSDEVAFLSLHLTPDSFLRVSSESCGGSACTTAGFVHTGDAGAISGSFGNYPDPVGTPYVTWSANIDTQFGCGNAQIFPIEQQWSTLTHNDVDLGAIARGPAGGQSWTFQGNPGTLSGQNPSIPCTFHYHWAAGLKISREKPPTVPPPPAVNVKTLPPPSGKFTVKSAAQDDLRELLPEAALWCGRAATGTGALVVGLSPSFAFTSFGIGVAGAELFAASAGVCGPYAQAIASLIQVINDPPLAGAHLLARAASRTDVGFAGACPHWPHQPAGFCASWSADQARLLGGVVTMRGVFAAMATTIGRESAADQNHDTAAASLQDTHLVSLNAQATTAVQEFRAASAALASLYQRAGLRITMSSAQDASALDALTTRLAALGVTRAALQQLAGDQLKPTATNVLTVLALNAGASSSSAASAGTPQGATVISSVQFTGSPTNPTITLRGEGLTPLPAPDPTGSPAGHNGCPGAPGDMGTDYGINLYLADQTKNWSAGNSTSNNTSCIGLIPTTVTPTELVFRLGTFYTHRYPQFTLSTGDEVRLIDRSATLDVRVAYGPPLR